MHTFWGRVLYPEWSKVPTDILTVINKTVLMRAVLFAHRLQIHLGTPCSVSVSVLPCWGIGFVHIVRGRSRLSGFAAAYGCPEPPSKDGSQDVGIENILWDLLGIGRGSGLVGVNLKGGQSGAVSVCPFSEEIQPVAGQSA